MKEYTIVVDGIEHTIQATDEDAKARGLVLKQAAPANKAKTAANKKA